MEGRKVGFQEYGLTVIECEKAIFRKPRLHTLCQWGHCQPASSSCSLVRMTKFGKGDRKSHLGWHKLHTLGWRLMLTAGMWHSTLKGEAFHSPVTYAVLLQPLFHCQNIVPTESSLFFKSVSSTTKEIWISFIPIRNTQILGNFSHYRTLWTLQTQRT